MIQQASELSGERFVVRYHLRCETEAEARAGARAICYEQTVEVPEEVVPGRIREQIVGRVEDLRLVSAGVFEAAISYAVETAGTELPQLLNVIFGNISLQPGIRVARLELPSHRFSWLRGPRFGRAGLRERLGVAERPLLCTALKPMGLSVKELAGMAYQLAAGGIDLIKDDHGLSDQPFAPFKERVSRCADAVARANRERGGHSIYLPNVTAPAGASVERSAFAKQAGAGGLLLSPGLVGWDTMREIAEDDRIGLPIMSHPAWLGSFLADPCSGLSHAVLFSQLPRLAGADAVIFPHFGGRFSFSQQACREIADATGEAMGHFKPILPTPGGGISLEKVPAVCDFYGPHVILLIGGNLQRQGPDLAATCRQLHQLVSERSTYHEG